MAYDHWTRNRKTKTKFIQMPFVSLDSFSPKRHPVHAHKLYILYWKIPDITIPSQRNQLVRTECGKSSSKRFNWWLLNNSTGNFRQYQLSYGILFCVFVVLFALFSFYFRFCFRIFSTFLFMGNSHWPISISNL